MLKVHESAVNASHMASNPFPQQNTPGGQLNLKDNGPNNYSEDDEALVY